MNCQHKDAITITLLHQCTAANFRSHVLEQRWQICLVYYVAEFATVIMYIFCLKLHQISMVHIYKHYKRPHGFHIQDWQVIEATLAMLAKIVRITSFYFQIVYIVILYMVTSATIPNILKNIFQFYKYVFQTI